MKISRRKYILVEMTAAVLILVISTAVMLPRFLQVQNFNTPGNFPDPILRSAIEEVLGIEPEGRITHSQLLTITTLRLLHTEVNNIKGLEYLKNLYDLRIKSNTVTNLDFGNIPKLTELVCIGRRISSINITACKNLHTCKISNTNIIELDTTGNPNLVMLSCNDNRIQELDVTQNKQLNTLHCYRNPLKKINISGLLNLEVLNFSKTEVTDIDLSTNRALTSLSFEKSKIKSIDLTQNINLNELFCPNNAIGVLDISNNINLRNVNVNYCKLTGLDASNNPNLENLNLADNQFELIPDFRSNTKLISLQLNFNLLDCEDWESFKQQEMKIKQIQFFPQRKMAIKNCAEDIEMYQLNENRQSN